MHDEARREARCRLSLAAADHRLQPFRGSSGRIESRGIERRSNFRFVAQQAAGGLDRESAEGEAAGAASSPHQKISYIIGKWQIMNLLGRYKDQQGDKFRLGQFHDDLIKNGSLPLSIVEWILLDDDSSINKVISQK